jgi:hypothetical protein
MRNERRINLLLCLVIATLVGVSESAFGQKGINVRRTIVGYVKSRDGRPVSNATVCAFWTRPIQGAVPCGRSNLRGRFAFVVWAPDKYTITAEKISAGYPDPRFSFYGKFFGERPVVIVNDVELPRPVTIILGPRAGRANFTIIDDVANRPFEKGSIEACRTDNPKICSGLSTAFPHGKYQLLTPEVPFTVRFKAWTGQNWVTRSAFDDAGKPVEVLEVGLGHQKEITIRLK